MVGLLLKFVKTAISHQRNSAIQHTRERCI